MALLYIRLCDIFAVIHFSLCFPSLFKYMEQKSFFFILIKSRGHTIIYLCLYFSRLCVVWLRCVVFQKRNEKLLYYFSFQLKISSKEIREYNNDMCRVSSIQYFVFGYFFSSLALILYHFITYAHLCLLLFVTKRSKFYDFLRNFALCTLTYMIIIIFVIILIMLIIYNKKNFSTFYQI